MTLFDLKVDDNNPVTKQLKHCNLYHLGRKVFPIGALMEASKSDTEVKGNGIFPT